MTLSPREQLSSAAMIAHHEMVGSLIKTQGALEALVRDIPDFTCLASLDGQLIWGNTQAARWFACEADFVYRQHLSLLFTPEYAQQFLDQLATLKTNSQEPKIIEFQIPVIRNGQLRIILWSVRPFDHLSLRRGPVFLILGRDITDFLAERNARTRLESELETAQLVQAAFFPAKSIQTPHLLLSSFYRPAEMCSGDWWGHFQLGDGLDLVCIADVSGHGAASALVTAMTQATCLCYVSQVKSQASVLQIDPRQILSQLNQIIFATFAGNCFMTFFSLIFDQKAGEVRASNAGHNFPYILQQGANGERNSPEPLKISGNPVGFEPNTTYSQVSWPLNKGDRYVLFTDGLVECRNKVSRPLGVSSFKRLMLRHKNEIQADFRENLVKNCLDHYGTTPLSDDITLIVIDML